MKQKKRTPKKKKRKAETYHFGIGIFFGTAIVIACGSGGWPSFNDFSPFSKEINLENQISEDIHKAFQNIDHFKNDYRPEQIFSYVKDLEELSPNLKTKKQAKNTLCHSLTQLPPKKLNYFAEQIRSRNFRKILPCRKKLIGKLISLRSNEP